MPDLFELAASVLDGLMYGTSGYLRWITRSFLEFAQPEIIKGKFPCYSIINTD